MFHLIVCVEIICKPLLLQRGYFVLDLRLVNFLSLNISFNHALQVGCDLVGQLVLEFFYNIGFLKYAGCLFNRLFFTFADNFIKALPVSPCKVQ